MTVKCTENFAPSQNVNKQEIPSAQWVPYVMGRGHRVKMLMSPILKSVCIVIFHMFAKMFRPFKPLKSDFKLKNDTLKVDPYFVNLSKIILYVMRNSDPRSENWKFSHESTGFHGCVIHQKKRLELSFQVICVTIALTRVRTPVFSQNHHALWTVLVSREPEIGHK